jgi:hypothetical protein
MFSGNCLAELKVMSLNAEWLWTPHDGYADGERFNRGDMSSLAYEREISFYAELVQRQGVQILAISEIENRLVVDDLARRIGRGWVAYFKQGRDTATGQDVALLSNLPIVKGSLTDFGFPAGKIAGSNKKKRLSKLVGAVFEFGSADISADNKVGVITAHFLSKRRNSKKKDLNRQRQAKALVKAISVLSKRSRRLVVLGDFNDTIDSPTLNLLTAKLEKDLINDCSGKALSAYQVKKRIDHILFTGFDCVLQKSIDLKKYSDHEAIMVTLN